MSSLIRILRRRHYLAGCRVISFSVVTLFLGLSSAGSPLAAADDTVILQIRDQEGNPLPDAVVEVLQGGGSGTGGPEIGQRTDRIVMDQVDKRFVPQLLVVQQGQQVHFPNSDDIRHHVYSFSPAKPFELKMYQGDTQDPVLFENSGVVVLGCNIHDSMVGYIYVADSPAVHVTDAEGQVTLPVENTQARLHVWHARQAAGPEERRVVRLSDLETSLDGRYRIDMEIAPPEPRNTFRALFSETDS